MSDAESRLALYEAQLEQLRTENDQLRRSAQAFGELAERLNRALLIASAAHSLTPARQAASPSTWGNDSRPVRRSSCAT